MSPDQHKKVTFVAPIYLISDQIILISIQASSCTVPDITYLPTFVMPSFAREIQEATQYINSLLVEIRNARVAYEDAEGTSLDMTRSGATSKTLVENVECV